MQNIIVTVDFDDKNKVLIKNAKKLAKVFGSKVWILQIAALGRNFVG